MNKSNQIIKQIIKYENKLNTLNNKVIGIYKRKMNKLNNRHKSILLIIVLPDIMIKGELYSYLNRKYPKQRKDN